MKKILWKNKWLQVTEHNHNGHLWYSADRPKPDVVHIFAVTPEKELLLVKQFRYPVDRFVVALPAGLVDEGETPEDAAHRELLEETGYVADSLEFCGAYPNSSGLTNEISHMFLAHDLKFVTHKIDEDEGLELYKVPLPELHARLAEYQRVGYYTSLKITAMMYMADAFSNP